MAGPDVDVSATVAEDLGRQAVEWMIATGTAEPSDLSLYHGQAGVLISMHDAATHFEEDRYVEAAELRTTHLLERVDSMADSSLYFGATGIAFALSTVGLDDEAFRILTAVRTRAIDGRWGPMFELLSGNAGIGLGALAVGDIGLAIEAVEPYGLAWEETVNGVNWPVRPTPPRSHHIAHGTLGIVYALAAVGHAANRQDLLELALAGANDVVARNEREPEGFLVPHSDPPHRPDDIDRYSLGWCNGPAGDAQVFRMLAQITGDNAWAHHARQCWHTITTSGLRRDCGPGSGTTTGGVVGQRACSLSRLTALWRAMTPQNSPRSSSRTCRSARLSMGSVQGGRTTSTERIHQSSTRTWVGPWATLA
ncbi:MAG: lanthionine synthetase LanC family protein [Nocardioides sp.]